jgi:hypothetical protein
MVITGYYMQAAMAPFLKRSGIRKREEVLRKIEQLHEQWEQVNKQNDEAPLKRDMLSKIDGSLTALRWALKEIEDF